jgi:hypothetical protein
MRAAGALRCTSRCALEDVRVYYSPRCVTWPWCLWREMIWGSLYSLALGGPFSAVNHVWCQMNSSPPRWCGGASRASSIGIETSSNRHKGLQIIQWAVAGARSSALFVFSFRIHPAGGVICSPSRFALCVFNQNEAGCQRSCVAGNLIWADV